MSNSELKAKIAKIEAMNPAPGGLLEKRLSRLKSELNPIDMVALLIGE